MSSKSLVWKDRLHQWKLAREKLLYKRKSHISVTEEPDAADADELGILLSETDNKNWGILSRKVPISPEKLHPYRFTVISYFIVMGLFLRFRFSHPVNNAHGLWVASVFSEAWLSVFSFLETLLKWQPVKRETYPERLCMRYNGPGEPNSLCSVDVFVCIADRQNMSPLAMSNTILSILSVDYPSEKVSCYISDDGASLLTLKTLTETTEFARRWVPFCKKFSIEPRAPESYFSEKVDYARFSMYPTFPKERRSIKRKYEEFKAHINDIKATFQNVPPEGWMLKDDTPWPANDVRDHPAMIQIMTGPGGPVNYDNESLPRLVYVARERQPGFQDNDNPGALNALVRVSALLSNGVYILNLDCNHYINNSKIFLEAMCFMMDPSNDKICFVQFPRRFDCIGAHDQHASHKTVFYDITLKCLDGIQGPIYVGSCCFVFRKALYGYHPPFDPKMFHGSCTSRNRISTVDEDVTSELSSFEGRPNSPLEEISKFERKFPGGCLSMKRCFGNSPILIASNLVSDDRFAWSITTDEILREAIQVISCDYEDSTSWGKEIGWIYGFHASDILTGLKMHACGWRSVYHMPACAAFRGYASVDLTHQLREVLLSAIGSVETLFSKYCPLWYAYGGQLKLLERVAYINATIYPFTSIPLLIYSTLPAVCLFSGKFIMPITYQASGWLALLLLAFTLNGLAEIRWSGVGIKELWRNQQLWLITGLSSHLCAVIKACGSAMLCCKRSKSTRVTTKIGDSLELYASKSSLLLLPTALVLINLLAMLVGIFSFFAHGHGSLAQIIVKLIYALSIVFHLHPFLKVLSDRKQIRTPVVLWSFLIAIMFAVLWINLDPFTIRFKGPDVKDCSIEC